MWSGISATNRVDVVANDGLFRYGRVVDVTNWGLLIDFLCPKRRRELVPFHRVFRCRTDPPVDGERIASVYTRARSPVPVEVLERDSSSDAWTWFPAEMINLTDGTQHSTYIVAVVKWWDEGERTDLVPVERIRWSVPRHWWAEHRWPEPRSIVATTWTPPTGASWPDRFKRNTFTKRFIKVPVNYTLPAKEILKRLKSSGPVPFVEVVTGYVWYIHLEGWRFVDSALEKLQNELSASVLRMIAEMTGHPADCGAEVDFPALPTELWREVFSHGSAPNVIVNSADFEATQSDRLVYYMTAPIFKCLRPATHRLIVCDGRRVRKPPARPSLQNVVMDEKCHLMKDNDVFKVLDVLRYIGQEHTGARLKTFYLVGFHCRLRIGAGYLPRACELHGSGSKAVNWVYVEGARCYFRLDYFIASCRGVPCDFFRFVNCSVHLHYTFWTRRRYIRPTKPFICTTKPISIRLA
ncbi:uncharacterized protein LOC129600776 [Paramacrobiotus metropolitanus]|uniref:uncharacterized protein LOC129600776 n=1 Tax=Paramacrobiotus metropolitanus TaxID=2943436 RepID=UPI0024457E79|nr:uncharacterized protein LOC129600776 [Paramacrobiotus metropolitanus]